MRKAQLCAHVLYQVVLIPVSSSQLSGSLLKMQASTRVSSGLESGNLDFK